ncbi:MAG: tRNA (guanosine(46)-N7)-methyltransferase TrmB [Proteocatella sp.]
MRYRKPKNYKDKILEFDGDIIINSEEETKGRWHLFFENENPIFVEIGMGKGKFILEHAVRNPDINYIGIEKIEPLIIGTAKNIKEMNLKNIKLISINANFIEDYFDESEISKIFLNFSDPWPKKRNANKRLTHTNMLKKYENILKSDSNIEFKTDNRDLFEFSVCETSNVNHKIEELQLDLHNHQFENDDERIIKTEYENKFVDMGKKIYRMKTKITKI